MKKTTELLKRIMTPVAVVMILSAVLRIIISAILGNTFLSSERMDDVLMLSYAAVKSHYLQPTVYSMAKTMVFPLFLDLVYASHLSYNIVISLLCIAASLVLYAVFSRVFRKKAAGLFAYLYFLFIPPAFDWWCGLRVYRNAVIPPFLAVLFAMLIYAVYRAFHEEDGEESRKPKRPVLRESVFYVLLGIVFTVTYYIREDGLWILACTVVFLAAACAGNIRRLIRKPGKPALFVRTLLVFVPLLLFFLNTQIYRSVNRHFYGVPEIETRTAGKKGAFLARLYRIDSPDRSSVVWIPADVIDQAVRVSPTLQSAPGFRDALILHERAEGDLYENPIPGEGLSWVIMDVMVTTGLYESEAQSEAFFAAVNAELDEAFRDGRLRETDRIQLLQSGGGFTKEEILELGRELRYGFRGAVLMKGYIIGAQETVFPEDPEEQEVLAFAARLCREPSLSDRGSAGLSAAQAAVNGVLKGYFPIAGILNALFFAAGILAAIAGFAGLFRKKGVDFLPALLRWLGLCCFYGIGAVYLFGISWYSHFIWGDGPVNTEIFNYYLIALPCILMFCYIFTFDRLYERIEKIIRGKKRPGKEGNR